MRDFLNIYPQFGNEKHWELFFKNMNNALDDDDIDIYIDNLKKNTSHKITNMVDESNTMCMSDILQGFTV